MNGPISESLWYRFDVSRYGSDGYVDRMSPSSSNVTGSLLWRPSRRAELRFSVDYLDDDAGSYFGTPLLPTEAVADPLDVITTTTGEGLDARTRFLNYNVEDAVNDSQQLLLRADAEVRLSDQVTLRNTVYGFNAERNWQNAEGFPYCTSVVDVCTSVGEIQRYYGYFFVDHDQQLFGDRVHLDIRTPVGALENRATVGFEASTLDFERGRGFRRRVPLAPGDAVDVLNPVPGTYGPRELRGISPTYINSRAFFAEDSLQVTSRVRLTGALRYEAMDLERVNLDAAGAVEPSGFERDFRWWSWRAGGVVNLRRDLAAYGQYSDAKDPVNANLFLVNANQDFDLTDARQWEVGLKADLDGGRTQLTAAWFDIERDDILDGSPSTAPRRSAASSRAVSSSRCRPVRRTTRWSARALPGPTLPSYLRRTSHDSPATPRPTFRGPLPTSRAATGTSAAHRSRWVAPSVWSVIVRPTTPTRSR